MDGYNLFPVFCFQRLKDMWSLEIVRFISLKYLNPLHGVSFSFHSPKDPRQKRLCRRKSPNDVHGTYAPVTSGQKSVDSSPGRSPRQPSLHPEHVTGSAAAWARIPAQAPLRAQARSLLPGRWANPQGKEALRRSSCLPSSQMGFAIKSKWNSHCSFPPRGWQPDILPNTKAPGCLLPAC